MQLQYLVGFILLKLWSSSVHVYNKLSFVISGIKYLVITVV